jgi:hypothetical protein
VNDFEMIQRAITGQFKMRKSCENRSYFEHPIELPTDFQCDSCLYVCMLSTLPWTTQDAATDAKASASTESNYVCIAGKEKMSTNLLASPTEARKPYRT